MNGIERDEAREERIDMEATVDAYDRWERALGWYYYLEEKMAFPFRARCVRERAISPLHEGEEVEVVEMAPEDECESAMFVMIKWQGRSFGIPLAQLEPMDVDSETQEAIEDWHYWVARGYEF